MGDKTEREELFQKSIASDVERARFAESWALMINEVLPEETSVRNIFTVENIPAGAVPIYTNDVQPISAWYLPKFGQVPQNIVEIDEVTVPTFELMGDVEYKLRDAKHARISIADRAMMRLKDSMIEQEEEAGWALLRAASSGSAISVSGAVGLTKAVVDKAWREMETNRGYKVTDIYVSASGMADIRAWTQTTIDPVTQREIFVNAGMPSIYGAQIHVVHFLASTEAYFIDATPNKLGFMPIRDELQTFDDPVAIKKFRVGVLAREEIGFVVMDAHAIVAATLTN
jgi:hypothetical protein